MRVDFYQLGAAHPDGVIAAIAGRLFSEGQRLLVVASEEAVLVRLDRQLWDQGAASFLPHGLAGGSDDAAQPILLSTGADAPNLARNVLIADGEWRDIRLDHPGIELGNVHQSAEQAFHVFQRVADVAHQRRAA